LLDSLLQETSMEGETSELENLDSELVMSFYDQYHADDMSKVYGDFSDKLEGVNDLKNNLSPDVATQTTQVWSLPDLLVGLDNLHRLHPDQDTLSGDQDTLHRVQDNLSHHQDNLSRVQETPPVSSTSHSTIPSFHSILLSNSNILNTIPSLELSKTNLSENRSQIFDSHRQSTDFLLEGLGILPPSLHTPVKSEPTIPPSYQSLDSLDLEMTPFELNLKSEPGMNTSVTLSSLCNLAQIPGLDILSKCESPVSVDSLLTHHCTILPPEIVSDEGILQPGLRTANFVATVDDITDHPLSEASHSFLLQDSLKEEEEECLDKPAEMETNPSYKRCHLCVRIFSTKANLSSHIRHVHLGETKHSRVKSIPCPHCNKMFSRKGHMTEHVRTVHEGKKRIYKEVNCQHCGKTFRRKWGLNIHISSAHADVVSSLLKQP